MKPYILIILIVLIATFLIGTVCAANPSDSSATSTHAGYSKYYYMFVHGNNAVPGPSPDLVTSPIYTFNGFQMTVPTGYPGIATHGYLHCPLVGFASINGVHPMIRYITFTLSTTYTTTPGELSVDYIKITNGPYDVITSYPNYYSGNSADFTYDMGAYHDFYRGLNAHLGVRNTGGYDEMFILSAYGAKMEYN